MCSPLATGSRHASWTIWARWRGGNPTGAPGSDRRGQQLGQPAPFVTAAGPPDGGLIALHLEGDGAVVHTAGVGQDDPGTPDLIPGQGLAPGDLLEDRQVGRVNGERLGFSSTHRGTSSRRVAIDPSVLGSLEFLALFMSGDTRTRALLHQA